MNRHENSVAVCRAFTLLVVCLSVVSDTTQTAFTDETVVVELPKSGGQRLQDMPVWAVANPDGRRRLTPSSSMQLVGVDVRRIHRKVDDVSTSESRTHENNSTAGDDDEMSLADQLHLARIRWVAVEFEFDSNVTDLGVVLDNQLSMQAQVAAVCRSCFYQLRHLRVVQRSLTRDVLQSLVQAFVTCRLDYCNAILTGAADGQIRRLQVVQNATARLVSEARRRDCILPILRSLKFSLAASTKTCDF